MRQLIHCPNCAPDAESRAIYDADRYARIKTCRACGHTLPFIPRVSAKRRAIDALFDELLAALEKMETSQ